MVACERAVALAPDKMRGVSDRKAEEVLARMTGPNLAVAERAFDDACRHPDREAILTAALDAEPQWVSAVRIVAALGDLDGEASLLALRRALNTRGRGSSDVRSVAAMALAKRCGPDVTPLLAALVVDAHTADAALHSLAAVGDDRAWDAVYGRLSRLARRKVKLSPDSAVVLAVAYLGRHVADRPDRCVTLVEQLRALWAELLDRDHAWVDHHWPNAAPEGPPADAVAAPDSDEITVWAMRTHPLIGRSPPS